jgi:hypothetical protein
MGWTPETLCDRADIIDVQHRYAAGIDGRDWRLYRSVFAEIVRFDFSSWYGGEAEEIEADAWVERVAARQSGFDATQHQMSNHVVTLGGSTAECMTYIVARHCLVLDGVQHLQVIGGYYSNRLAKLEETWKITSCTLKVRWTTGDRRLFDLAAERAAERLAAGASVVG